ncbi:hypothetical protein G9C85_06885 [Halorubellus sp. JP-L1]|uniref:hypothetical protein n=1 Tax=Halorubellus sp. JP-L1 TaxID=2715753 RepID=UPI001407651D|nr:hypothetical protein [Halorubellus sp. JP-L1]
MIVVATADFEVYHDVVGELRDRGVAFTTVEPDADLPEETAVVVTGPGEGDEFDGPHVVEAEPDAPRRAVEAALAYLRGGDGRTVVGVDPGRKPGIAVLAGDVVVAAFQVPASEAADVVREEVADEADAVVRVGDGARREGAKVIGGLSDARVELVDETGTTPSLGTGARGMGDVLAAVNIARTEGEIVESRDFEPTDGEIQRVKHRSRELSPENRAVDTALARRVARGELDVETALDEHRARDDADDAGERGDEFGDGGCDDESANDGCGDDESGSEE